MEKAIKLFKSEKLQLLVLALAATVTRTYFLLKYENMPGNATEYIVRALNILDNPDFFFNFEGNCSTFFTYILASLLSFWKDPMLAPRVFTMIFGIFLVLPYYGTIRNLFDRKIAFFSALALALCPLHIVQSTSATPDAAYYFFLFGCFYYFFRYHERQKTIFELLFSAFLFNTAALLRFESWVFIPVLFLFQWPRGKKKAILLMILLTVGPCLWLLLNDIVYQDFAFSFRTAALTASIEIASSKVPYDPGVFSWLKVLQRSAGPSLVAAGILGMAVAIFRRIKMQLGFFFLILFLLFTVNSCSAKMWHNERYAIILVLFLIPYAWFFVEQGLVFFRGRIRALLFVLCCFFLIYDGLRIVRRPFDAIPHILNFLPREVQNIAVWLKENVGKNETLIMGGDPADVHDSYILIRGNIMPPRRCLVIRATDPYFKAGEPFKDFMQKSRPAYLILNSKSALQEKIQFQFSETTQSYEGALFYKVYEKEVTGYRMRYYIYKITYEGKLSVG